jgi:hypothetical protein
LEETAVEQDAGMLRMYDVPRAGDISTDCPYEFNLHARPASFGRR